MLAAATMLLWSTLPVALDIALAATDVITLTWLRFAFAAVVVGCWLAATGKLGQYRNLSKRAGLLLTLASVMLIGNYLLYLAGLDHSSPATAQLLIQLAPILMALGGIIIFRERFTKAQWMGLALLGIGLVVFCVDRAGDAGISIGRWKTGAALIIAAAVVWAIYALAQKALLESLGSSAILLVIYCVAALVLLPFGQPLALAAVATPLQWIAIGYCALNTLLAYGAFAEALAHWPASRVGMVLALSPIGTLAFVALMHRLMPGVVDAERIGSLGLIGMAVAVSGSIIANLPHRRRSRAVVAAGPSEVLLDSGGRS